MELEDLKSIWKSSEPVFQPKNEQEIAMMLKGRSISIINKLKRNVWFELVFTIVVSVALLIYALSLQRGAMKWTSISLLLMCLASTIYYIKKLPFCQSIFWLIKDRFYLSLAKKFAYIFDFYLSL